MSGLRPDMVSVTMPIPWFVFLFSLSNGILAVVVGILVFSISLI